MVKTQIYIPQKEFFDLKLASERLGVPYSQIVRDAVSAYLPKIQAKKKKPFDWSKEAKKYASPMGGNIASRIDDILYGGEDI